MQQLTQDLWQSRRYSAGILNSYAYYLLTPRAKILIYNPNHPTDWDEIESLGGVDEIWLTHRDEATPSLALLVERFGCRLWCSPAEREAVAEKSPVYGQFSAAGERRFGVDIITTPGHTDGSVCFYYPSPATGKDYLFSGDTLFLNHGNWSTLVLEQAGGSVGQLHDSLQKLERYPPHWLLSSGFVGDRGIARIDTQQWSEILQQQQLSLVQQEVCQ